MHQKKRGNAQIIARSPSPEANASPDDADRDKNASKLSQKNDAEPTPVAPAKKAIQFVMGCDSSFNARSRQDPYVQKYFINKSEYTGGQLYPTMNYVTAARTQSYKYHEPHQKRDVRARLPAWYEKGYVP